MRPGLVGIGLGDGAGAGHGLLEAARGEIGAHEGGLRAGAHLARLAGEVGQEPFELVRALLRGERGGAEGLGRGAALALGQGVQALHDLVEAHPVLLRKAHAAARLEKAQVARGEAQRVGHHARGGLGAAPVGEELGIAQRFLGRRARELDRAGQHLAGEVLVAVQDMRLRHHGHDLGIARAGAQRGAQRGDGRVGIVVRDRPGGAELVGLGAGGIDPERVLHGGARAHPVAGGEPHAREGDVEARALHRPERLRPALAVGLVQKRGHGLDARLGAAGLEVEPGAHGAQERPVGHVLAGEQRVELGAQRLGPAHLAQELQKRQPVLPGGVLRVDPLAQEGLGAVLVALRQEKAQIGLGDLPVLGKEPRGGGELLAELLLVVHLREDADAQAPELRLVGAEREPVVHQRQRGLGAALAHDAVDHHQPRGGDGGIVRQRGARGLRGLGPGGVVLGLQRVPVGERGGGGAQARVLGGELEPGLRMAAHLVPVAPVHGDQRQRAARLDVVGILLDEAQVVAIGARIVAVRDQELGIGGARVAVESVEVEDVPELELGAHRIVRRDQPQRLLVVGLGALLGALAGGEQREGEDRQGAAEGHVIWDPERTRRDPPSIDQTRRRGNAAGHGRTKC